MREESPQPDEWAGRCGAEQLARKRMNERGSGGEPPDQGPTKDEDGCESSFTTR